MPFRRRSDAHPRRDPIVEAIARRAFELFLARGQQHGHALDDWLQAEREFAQAAESRPAAAQALNRRDTPRYGNGRIGPSDAASSADEATTTGRAPNSDSEISWRRRARRG
jgi:hypothetical protein